MRHLRAGQVFSLPAANMEPALIDGISDPVGNVRFVLCLDPADGTPVEVRRVLGLDRTVVVHDVEVWHHHYTNTSDVELEVRLGRREETVAPGETLHYTGEARPDTFPVSAWKHQVEPIVTG